MNRCFKCNQSLGLFGWIQKLIAPDMSTMCPICGFQWQFIGEKLIWKENRKWITHRKSYLTVFFEEIK
jgi:hypothetical protein